MAVSNKITAYVSFITLLCAIMITAAGVWLANKPESDCVRQFQWAVAILGALLLFASLAGCVGATWNKEGLLLIYLLFMATLVALLLILLVGAFIVTRPTVPAAGSRDYRHALTRFSPWLREHVTGNGRWKEVSGCLSRSHLCLSLNRDYVAPSDQSQLMPVSAVSPLQAGCCKPPTICGFTSVSPVTWTSAVNQPADPDCYIWNNNPTLLCYGCESCKAGLLTNLTHDWRKINIILLVAALVLICVYLIACSAFKNAQVKGLFQQGKQ